MPTNGGARETFVLLFAGFAVGVASTAFVASRWTHHHHRADDENQEVRFRRRSRAIDGRLGGRPRHDNKGDGDDDQDRGDHGDGGTATTTTTAAVVSAKATTTAEASRDLPLMPFIGRGDNLLPDPLHPYGAHDDDDEAATRATAADGDAYGVAVDDTRRKKDAARRGDGDGTVGEHAATMTSASFAETDDHSATMRTGAAAATTTKPSKVEGSAAVGGAMLAPAEAAAAKTTTTTAVDAAVAAKLKKAAKVHRKEGRKDGECEESDDANRKGDHMKEKAAAARTDPTATRSGEAEVTKIAVSAAASKADKLKAVKTKKEEKKDSTTTAKAKAKATKKKNKAPLYITIGPPCSGKTTLLSSLLQRRRVLDSDGDGKGNGTDRGGEKGTESSSTALGGRASPSRSSVDTNATNSTAGDVNDDDDEDAIHHHPRSDVALDDMPGVYIKVPTRYFLTERAPQEGKKEEDARPPSSWSAARTSPPFKDLADADANKNDADDSLSFLQERIMGKTVSSRLYEADPHNNGHNSNDEFRTVLQRLTGRIDRGTFRARIMAKATDDASVKRQRKKQNSKSKSKNKTKGEKTTNQSPPTTTTTKKKNGKFEGFNRSGGDKAALERPGAQPAPTDDDALGAIARDAAASVIDQQEEEKVETVEEAEETAASTSEKILVDLSFHEQFVDVVEDFLVEEMAQLRRNNCLSGDDGSNGGVIGDDAATLSGVLSQRYPDVLGPNGSVDLFIVESIFRHRTRSSFPPSVVEPLFGSSPPSPSPSSLPLSTNRRAPGESEGCCVSGGTTTKKNEKRKRATMTTALDEAQFLLRSLATHERWADAPLAWGNTNVRPKDYVAALDAAEVSGRPVVFLPYVDPDVIWLSQDDDDGKGGSIGDGTKGLLAAVPILPRVETSELLRRNLHRLLRTGRYVPSVTIRDSAKRVNNTLQLASREMRRLYPLSPVSLSSASAVAKESSQPGNDNSTGVKRDGKNAVGKAQQQRRARMRAATTTTNEQEQEAPPHRRCHTKFHFDAALARLGNFAMNDDRTVKKLSVASTKAKANNNAKRQRQPRSRKPPQERRQQPQSRIIVEGSADGDGAASVGDADRQESSNAAIEKDPTMTAPGRGRGGRGSSAGRSRRHTTAVAATAPDRTKKAGPSPANGRRTAQGRPKKDSGAERDGGQG